MERFSITQLTTQDAQSVGKILERERDRLFRRIEMNQKNLFFQKKNGLLYGEGDPECIGSWSYHIKSSESVIDALTASRNEILHLIGRMSLIPF